MSASTNTTRKAIREAVSKAIDHHHRTGFDSYQCRGCPDVHVAFVGTSRRAETNHQADMAVAAFLDAVRNNPEIAQIMNDAGCRMVDRVTANEVHGILIGALSALAAYMNEEAGTPAQDPVV